MHCTASWPRSVAYHLSLLSLIALIAERRIRRTSCSILVYGAVDRIVCILNTVVSYWTYIYCNLTGKKEPLQHGQVGTQEVREKGKVQGEAESGAQDCASQRTEHHGYEFQSAQDRVAQPVERTRRSRDTVQGQPKHQSKYATVPVCPPINVQRFL